MVPLTILNKYLHNDIIETEVNINISVNKNSEMFLKNIASSEYLQTPQSHLKLRLRSIIGLSVKCKPMMFSKSVLVLATYSLACGVFPSKRCQFQNMFLHSSP